MKELSNSYVTDKGNVVFRNVSKTAIEKIEEAENELRRKAWKSNTYLGKGGMFLDATPRQHDVLPNCRCESIPVPAKPKRNIWKTISILLSIGFYTYWVIKLT